MLYIFLKPPYQISFIEYIYESRWIALNWHLQSIYYSLYFFFFLYFLSINKYFVKLYKRLKTFLISVLILSTIIFFISVLKNNISLYESFYFYSYIPITFVLAVFVIYKSFFIPGKLKYFFIIGSSFYILSALMSFFLSIAQIKIEELPIWIERLLKHGGLFYFFIGILTEHMIFALGLAYRVKEINAKMILGFKEKEELRKNLNQELEEELVKKEIEVSKLIKKAEQQKLLKVKSELESEINKLHLTSLHSQMNPHFVFNALNSIKVFLIENDRKNAISYLNKFAKLIRKILEASRTETLSLAEELKIVELYINIETIRHTQKINFKIHTDNKISIDKIKVPPLILQPFIENAIWHGLAKKRGEKQLLIKISCNKNNQAELNIEDNGIGRKKSEEAKINRLLKKKSLGLQITKERLAFFNERENKNYSFEILDLEDHKGKPKGTRVNFFFTNKAKSYFSAG